MSESQISQITGLHGFYLSGMDQILNIARPTHNPPGGNLLLTFFRKILYPE